MKATHCLGFAFIDKKVVLIKKNKPDFQAGKLNGLGGAVEDSDLDSRCAMAREFREECGIETNPRLWAKFATMVFENSPAVVDCFVTVLPAFGNDLRTTTDEVIVAPYVSEVFLKQTAHPMMPNLPLLVQMAEAAVSGASPVYTLHEAGN